MKFVEIWGRLGMKSNWKTMLLSEIADFNPKESIKKGTIAKKIPMDKLRPFYRDIPEYIEEAFSGGTKFRNGDTIMARITPCLENGKIAKVSILENGEIGFGSTEYIVFRAKKDILDSDFLYYLVCSPNIKNPAIKSMVGSSGRQRVQIEVVKNIMLSIPPLNEQQKIGNFLKQIDDKIDLNNRINDNLQQQTQALFKKRYARYNTSNLPKGWTILKLGDVATICKKSFNPAKEPETMLEHYSIPAYDDARFPVFESSAEIKSNKYIIDDECFMISKLNPTTKRVWKPYCITKQAVCSTEFIVYKANNPLHTDFLYSLIDSDSFSNFMCSHVTGSTGSRQRTTPSDTLSYAFVLPDMDEIKVFSTLVKPMYELVKSNAIENTRLIHVRDSLLPKLISGEINVSDIDI